jgi:hypothetical protein
MILKLTNNLPSTKQGTTFDNIERGTVFEYEGDFYIKVNGCSALMFTETYQKDYWVEEDGFTGDEKVTVIESELILKSRRG